MKRAHTYNESQSDRVSGWTSNNARRQMSIPPPLFAPSARERTYKRDSLPSSPSRLDIYVYTLVLIFVTRFSCTFYFCRLYGSLNFIILMSSSAPWYTMYKSAHRSVGFFYVGCRAACVEKLSPRTFGNPIEFYALSNKIFQDWIIPWGLLKWLSYNRDTDSF